MEGLESKMNAFHQDIAKLRQDMESSVSNSTKSSEAYLMTLHNQVEDLVKKVQTEGSSLVSQMGSSEERIK